MKSKNWKLLLHTTDIKAFKNIIKNKALITPNESSDFKQHSDSKTAIYCHYYSNKLKSQYMNRGWRWLYGSTNVSIVLKKDILKDLRFRVCEGFSFGCEEKKKLYE